MDHERAIYGAIDGILPADNFRLIEHPAEGVGLVGGGVGDLIDDQDFGGAFGWPKLEAELFLENGKQRWVSGVGSFLGSPLDLKVEVAVEVGVVLDRTASLAAKRGGNVNHGHLRSPHDGP